MTRSFAHYLTPILTFKPDGEGDGGGAATDHDGTLFDAARVMPDIEALERGEQGAGAAAGAGEAAGEGEQKATRERNPDGTFKAKNKEGGEAENQAAGEGDNAGAEGGEDDEDYFELPPEKEGAEPTRLKASEVFDGYQRSKSLETELTELKSKSAAMPVEHEKATQELLTQMGNYQQAVKQFAAMQEGKEPDLALLDETSDKYNPALYAQQKQASEHSKAAAAAAKTELERVETEMMQHQRQLASARFEREQAKLKEFWPELVGNETEQARVMSEALKHYGITREDFNQLIDHRHYKVLKDALAYQTAAARTQVAVKIVKAKPKLVKGSARATTTAKDAQHQDAMTRLGQDPTSIDHAADALDRFLH